MAEYAYYLTPLKKWWGYSLYLSNEKVEYTLNNFKKVKYLPQTTLSKGDPNAFTV
jgi:hypothetical protein